jgi:hypothetical protein
MRHNALYFLKEFSMKSIRIGVFETNSSSTHSLTICSKAEFEAWRKGDVLFSIDSEKFMTMEEIKAEWEEDTANSKEKGYSYSETIEEYIEKNRIVTADNYDDEVNQETFEQHYKTASGDEIVAFGYYGFDR